MHHDDGSIQVFLIEPQRTRMGEDSHMLMKPANAKSVSFKNGELKVAGNLHLPADFDADRKYPALVIATPGSSVKEQIGANYAERMAQRGYAALAFDPSYQGQSTGEPRDLEDPAARVEDIRCAVDFLTTLDYINVEQIGMVGICAGGGYAVNAALTEHRLKAVGVVVPVNLGRANREANVTSGDAVIQALGAVGQQRTTEARGGEQRRDPWIPETVEAAKKAGVDVDTLDAVDFYRTPRGFSEYSTNRLLFRSNSLLLGFDAFHLVEELLTQPIQIIVGGRLGSTGSYADGKQLWERARNKEKLLVIEGAGHYDMYDKPEYVNPAVECLHAHFQKHLTGTATTN